MNYYHPAKTEMWKLAALRLRVSASSLGAMLLCLLFPFTSFAGISEPDTVFYGKIVNRTSGQEYLLTNGHLAWIIGSADGSQVTLTANLAAVRGGDFSYRLNVPHQALSSGLDISSGSVPLTIQASVCSHLQITVDGFAASIVAPGNANFAVAQSLRASTYRLDLELFNPLLDSDRDGIPDWWANRYGLDDANADPDHDGWTNLQEFRRGTDPNQDNRIPTLDTRELRVYADGTTGIRLHAIDADSSPSNLRFTLSSVPDAGTLYLRNNSLNGTNSDVALAAGASFTQDDVDKGRLVYAHPSGAVASPTSFGVTLQDEDPSHPATNRLVTLNVYRPNYSETTMQLAQAAAAAPSGAAPLAGLSPDEQQMTVNYFLSRDQGFIVWDLSRSTAPEQLAVPSSGLSSVEYSQYVSSYGPDRRQVLAGGVGGDRLAGGMENDILIGGRGDDTLRGNGGSDLFLITGPNDGNDTIEDFNVGEGDSIDISRVLQGASFYVTNYVQVTNEGTNSYLNINFQGSGAGFTNMRIALLGTHFTQSDLQTLVDNGNVITGDKGFAPRVSILASSSSASQNGPTSGLFTLTRSGAIDSGLTVTLYVSGSARAGLDYDLTTPQVTFVSGPNWQVTFLPGQRTAQVPVNPYGTIMGGAKVSQVNVSAGSGYEVGSPATASVSIEDLLPQITIEALGLPIAVRSDLTPAFFLITRGGIINQSVLVRLSIGGTATKSVDYDGVPAFINLNAGDTTALITVTPKSTAVLSNGIEDVQVSIQANVSYKALNPSAARIFIVDQMLSFSLWQQQNFPGSGQEDDPGNTGIPNLFRYAFGLDPQNPWSSSGIPAYSIQDGHLSVNFRHPMVVSDLDYIVEVSSDMLQWDSTAKAVEPFVPTPITNDPETVWYRCTDQVSATPKQFMRVRVVTH